MSRTTSKKLNDASLFSLVEDLLDGTTTEGNARERTARTLYLHGQNFKEFKAICEAKNTSASLVLDRWIAAFIERERPKAKSPKR